MAYDKLPTVNIWDELSRRFYGANRDYLKRVAMLSAYSGETDPWLDHMVGVELADIALTTHWRADDGIR